jgi:periplasmic protein TorT
MAWRSVRASVLATSGVLVSIFVAASAKAAEDWSIPVTNTAIDGKQSPGTWNPVDKAKISKSWNLCVLFPHLKDSYWLAMNYGVSSEVSRDRASMQLYQAGGYGNLSTQLNQIDNCIAQHADAIILGAISADGVGALVQKAAAANIPVIDVSNGINGPGVAGHALVSWYEAANSLGKYIVESSKGKKVSVGWFPGPEGAGFSTEANRGLTDALKNADNVKIAVTRWGDTGLNVQLDLIQNALQAYPDINYLVGVDIAGQAATVAVRNAGLEDKIKVGAYVIIPPVYEAIARGTGDAAVTDFTVMQGRMAVDMAVRTLEHQDLIANRSGPKLTIVTKENIKSIPWDEMFAPRDFKATYSVSAK